MERKSKENKKKKKEHKDGAADKKERMKMRSQVTK